MINESQRGHQENPDMSCSRRIAEFPWHVQIPMNLIQMLWSNGLSRPTSSSNSTIKVAAQERQIGREPFEVLSALSKCGKEGFPYLRHRLDER